ncbi:GMC family oxidoreductase [Flavobacteriaceae bacterium Ap0902]|nr:GMC family oxidoreductase [Flavobacteriaceae bacterium Ap0902]
MDRRTFAKLTGLGAVGISLEACGTLPILNSKRSKMGHVDNVIIGSGYGGAVTALRLTENGHKALLLEMGMRWDRTPEHDTFCKMITPDKRSSWLSKWPNSPITIPIPIKKYTGVLDKIKFNDMSIFAGRAYGGGSIVNGGIAITPKRKYFESIFPALDADKMFNQYFPLANKELKVEQIPEDFYDSTDYYAFSRSAEKQAHKANLKTEFFSNTYDFEYMRKEAQGEVYKSGLGGEVIYGNNAGKLSLDLTYLKKAEETGNLEIKTLRKLEKITQTEDGKYALEVAVLNTSGKTTETEIYTAGKVFLNAGSVGTSQILVKAKHEGDLPNLNDEVGQTWGPNGNIMTGRNFVNATGTKQSTIPVKGINMWDGDHPYQIFAEIAPLPLGIETWTTLFLSITNNPERGKFIYNKKSGEVTLDWKKSQNDYAVEAAKYLLEKLHIDNGGTRSRLLFNNGFGDDFSYHPLGGCVLGKATDFYGRVKGYDGLYINDSALIPGSAGVNPFVFITGLAEHNMEEILRKDFA